jgi:hypothetical protein
VIDLREFIREISENGRENHEQIKCCRCCACCSQVGTRHLRSMLVCVRARARILCWLWGTFSMNLVGWLSGFSALEILE